MKVLFVHNSADIYGASRSLERICRELQAKSYEVSVLVPQRGVLADRLRSSGIEVVVEPSLPVLDRKTLQNPLSMVRHMLLAAICMFRLVAFLRTSRPDLVHTNVSVVYVAAIAARICRIPHVWHIRESLEEFGLFGRTYMRLMRALSVSIVCISTYVRDQFGGSFGKELHVFLNAIDTEALRLPDEELTSRILKKYYLDGTFVVTCVGRLKLRRKGQEVLIQAISLLCDIVGRDKVRCLFVGTAAPGNEEHEAELRSMVTRLSLLDVCHFCGEVEDVRPYYRVSDVIVMPSTQPEPFGNVVIEGMAMCRPVVASSHGGPRDQIRPGVDGLLFSPGSATSLCKELLKLYLDPDLRKCMGRNARRRVEETFTIDRLISEIELLYQEVAQKNGKTIICE